MTAIETRGNAAWTLRFAGNRFDLDFADGDLRNTYFGPDFAGEYLGLVDHHQNRDRLLTTRPEAAVHIGPNRDRVLWQTVSADIGETSLALVLAAPSLMAKVEFILDAASGSILRRTTLTGQGGHDTHISGALSFSLLIGEPITRITYLTGRWANETQVRSIVPEFSALQLESRSGKTGFEFQPYVALETPTGYVIAELLWSGNWQLNARTREADGVVSGGLPDAGFAQLLASGDSLELPEAILVRVAGGLDAATRALHDRRRSLQLGVIPRLPVQFNSWYPNPGDPEIGAMQRLASRAFELGCEIFVLDGGWHVNDSDPLGDDPWQSTGDWKPNPRLFPNGLEELSDHCHSIGIGFGIWFEPEGIGHSSSLRQRHPEWHHWINGIPPDPARRAILHLGIDAARTHVRDVMVDIIRRTGATWVKWDFNADLVSGGWPADAQEYLRRTDPVLAHCQGLYRLQEELREACPGLVLEMCASGGGRFDGRLLRHAQTSWMSDQAQPLCNLSIHFGSHLAHPARLCNDWLIAWPAADFVRHGGGDPDLRGDLPFRLRVAMLGTFGISAKLQNWSDADMAVTTAHIAWYKAYARDVIESGDQYHLTPAPPLDGVGEWAAMWYAAKDRTHGVGFLFRLNEGQPVKSFRLGGLDDSMRYRVIEFDGPTRECSGAELAAGIVFEVPEIYHSIAVRVEPA